MIKEEGQEYALVVKMLGNGRLDAQLFDGRKTLAHIRGKLRKKVWIGVGDLILLSEREFEERKTDVIHKYNADEVHQLKKISEIPDFVNVATAQEPNEDLAALSEQEEEGIVNFEIDEI
ncbi:Translation initiation factor 1A [Spiromyces aspiralis]|uniref:Translation initiation factor 1A n=1 Tax=Spiromyces aspiralis TaxID=68401 RepID=A0ACC1HNS9_9FUNG|nr:Translation initiation factor 1A [Spiromyces aspiralis]